MDCVVYKSAKKEGCYLYIAAGKSPEDLPEKLRALLGHLAQVMNLTLSPERKLAQADVTEVIERLKDQGYYLQMPPHDYRRD